MNIYNIKNMSMNETSGISLNIYLSGCKGHCGQACHSKHTWNFNAGSELVIEDLITYLKDIPAFRFDHICILGGEPLDQPEKELLELLSIIKENFPSKPLWLYTQYKLGQVSCKITDKLDYIKTGKYLPKREPAKEQCGVFLASNNQVIYKL